MSDANLWDCFHCGSCCYYRESELCGSCEAERIMWKTIDEAFEPLMESQVTRGERRHLEAYLRSSIRGRK